MYKGDENEFAYSVCPSQLLSNVVILTIEKELSTNVSLDNAVTEFSGVGRRVLLH